MSKFGKVLGVRTEKAIFPLLNMLAVIHAQAFLYYELFAEP